jgi:hypothetical protein
MCLTEKARHIGGPPYHHCEGLKMSATAHDTQNKERTNLPRYPPASLSKEGRGICNDLLISYFDGWFPFALARPNGIDYGI